MDLGAQPYPLQGLLLTQDREGHLLFESSLWPVMMGEFGDCAGSDTSSVGEKEALTSDSDTSMGFSFSPTLSLSTAPLYLLQMSSSE